MHHDHCPRGQRDHPGDQPVHRPVIHVGPNVRQLTRRLHDRKRKRRELLVERESSAPLRALLPLELLQRGEGGRQELQEDRRVDIRHDAQRKQADLGNGTTREGVNVGQQAAAGRHGLAELCHVHPRKPDVDAQTGEDDQREHDGNLLREITEPIVVVIAAIATERRRLQRRQPLLSAPRQARGRRTEPEVHHGHLHRQRNLSVHPANAVGDPQRIPHGRSRQARRRLSVTAGIQPGIVLGPGRPQPTPVFHPRGGIRPNIHAHRL
mmetsp:Transcript_6373/g.17645  ORF Transcript_6373/g.17645 Transcript_6373/m.17645 type:complete len:266 (+) Transcript_6373:865-1662(+)